MTIKLPPMPEPHTPPTFATAANTPSVKAGYELGGYEKTPPLFDEHQMEAYAREAVRLNMAPLSDEQVKDHDCPLKRGAVLCRVCDLNTLAAYKSPATYQR